MRHSLKAHRDFPTSAVSGVEVEVARSGELLTLDYVVTGDVSRLILPAEAAPVRAEELWEHSCFEAFIGKEEDYLEVNLAPSCAWAAYRFHGRREGRYDAAINAPRIWTTRAAGHFTLRSEIPINWWAGPLGLSAVIEEVDGTKSYWALAHPPGEPDFHHPDCFALELPAATAP